MSTLRLTGQARAFRDGIQRFCSPGDIVLVPDDLKTGRCLGAIRVAPPRSAGSFLGYVATYGQGCIRITNWADAIPADLANYRSLAHRPFTVERMVEAITCIEGFALQEGENGWALGDPDRARKAIEFAAWCAA